MFYSLTTLKLKKKHLVFQKIYHRHISLVIRTECKKNTVLTNCISSCLLNSFSTRELYQNESDENFETGAQSPVQGNFSVEK